MSEETITVEMRVSGKWRTYLVIDDADIRADGITPEQVKDYIQQHPSPLDRLFTPRTLFRVVYSVSEEVSRFTMSNTAPPLALEAQS